MNDVRAKIVRYALAVATIGGAFLLRQALVRPVGELPPYITFYPAIMLVGLLAGMGPGLVATGLAAWITDGWILPRHDFLVPEKLSDAVALGFFTACGVLMSVVAEQYRRFRDRAAGLEKELAVRESETRFRTLFEHAPDAVLLTAPDGSVLAANPAACAMFRMSEAEICQAGREGLLDQDDPRLAVALEERQRLGHACAELTAIRNGGERFPVEIRSEILGDGALQSFVTLRDITRRKLSEEALRDSERRFRGLFDNAAVGVCQTSADGHYLLVNDRFCDMLGYTSAELQGRYIGQVTHPDDFQKELTQVRQLKSGLLESTTIGKRFVRKDGSNFPAEVTASVVRNATTGEVDYFVGVIRDVTERRQSEAERERLMEESRLNAQRLSWALQAAHGGAWDWDLETGKAWWSPEMYPLWGVAPGTPMFTETSLALVDDLDRERVQRSIAEGLKRHTPLQFEFRIQHATGGERWMESFGRAFYDADGRAVRLLGITFDISARKQATEELQDFQEQNQFLANVIEQASQPFAVGYSDGRFGLCNTAFENLVGYSAEELLQIDWIETLTPPEWLPTEFAMLKELHRTGQPVRYQKECLRKDGRRVPIELLMHLAHDAEGNALYYSFLNDVTARKQAEQERLELERRLLHAQKLESLGILAGGIAHDFNNILAGIMGYADLALLRGATIGAAQSDITEIKNAVQRAADLTRQMLAYSGKGKFVVQAMSLTHCVEDVRRMLEVSCSKKAELKYHLTAELPAIQADPAQITQVIMNLVINAAEALGEQEGVISIATDIRECDGADLEDGTFGQPLPAGAYVRLEVADTGCGMDQQTLGKIFDPFYTTKFTGRGLGLAAIQGIVRSHRGAIRVASTPGRGTTFEVLFPASGPPPARASHPAAPASAWHGAGAVLIVDDEELLRSLARQMVEHLGFSALTAKDGAEALELYRAHQPQIACVLLDLTMPKMSGVETFHELRRICPTVRVILSSGYSADEVAERFAGLELAGFLQKPYQFAALRATLANIERGKVAEAAPQRPDGNVVLVVDDDDVVRRSTQLLFQLAGFTALPAANGEEALPLYQAHQAEIVCVFLDLTMPTMDGLETLRELRRINDDVRVILASGYGERDVVERMAGQEVWRFFYKLDPLDALIGELQADLAAADLAANCRAG